MPIEKTKDKDKDKALEIALLQIEKAFGKGSIMRLGEAADRLAVEDRASAGDLARLPDDRHLPQQVREAVEVGKHVEPLAHLLHAGPTQEPRSLRPRADEPVLEPPMDDSQLVDGPQQPLVPCLRFERRHAERPERVGIEAEADREFGPCHPRRRRGVGRRRNRDDPVGRHVEVAAAAGDGRRPGDHEVGPPQAPAGETVAGRTAQLAGEPCAG